MAHNHEDSMGRCLGEDAAGIERCCYEPRPEGQTMAELLPLLQAAGYTHVQTFGGLLPIAEWQPYGNVPGGVNYRPSFREWRGSWNGGNQVTDYCDGPPNDRFVLGRWTLIRA